MPAFEIPHTEAFEVNGMAVLLDQNDGPRHLAGRNFLADQIADALQFRGRKTFKRSKLRQIVMPDVLARSDHNPMSEEALKDLQFRASGLLALEGSSKEIRTYFKQMAEDIQRVITEVLMLRELVPLELQIDAMALARKEVQRQKAVDSFFAQQQECDQLKDFIASLAGKNLRGATVEQLFQALDDWLA